MYALMLLLGANMYSPARFVNLSSGIGTDLSFISYIYVLLLVEVLNVVLSPPITILSLTIILICPQMTTKVVLLAAINVSKTILKSWLVLTESWLVLTESWFILTENWLVLTESWLVLIEGIIKVRRCVSGIRRVL